MTLADDCEVVLRLILSEGPLSIDDLCERCAFGRHKLNDLLTDLSLHGQIRSQAVRVKGRKIIQYGIKESFR